MMNDRVHRLIQVGDLWELFGEMAVEEVRAAERCLSPSLASWHIEDAVEIARSAWRKALRLSRARVAELVERERRREELRLPRSTKSGGQSLTAEAACGSEAAKEG